jgi:PAS domain S-box-containing protein
MHKALKTLVVEDSEKDFELLVRELERQGYIPSAERVETLDAMSAALARESWEIVISDYTLPHFSAPAALALLQKLGVDLPFIIVSGAVGEEAAVEALKAGARDYIVKGRWSRLGPAIERELREAQDRHQRKEAEQALENQRRFLNTLIESIPLPVFFKDTAERYLGCNRAFEELIGKTKEQMIGKSSYQIGCGKLAEKHHEIDGEILTHRGSRVYEHSLQEKNGASKNLIFNKATLTDSEGNVTGLVGVISDITGQKQAEQALRESEEQFRAIVEHSHAGIFMLDEAFRCVYANAQCSRITGYNREELVGSDFRQLVTEDYLDLMSDYYLRRQRGEAVPDHYTYAFVRKDGEKRIGELNVSVIIDAAGNKRTVGQVLDLTERKQAEEALEQLSARYEAILNEIPDIIMEADANHVYTWANPVGLEFFGEDVVGREAADYFVGEQDTYEKVEHLFAGDTSTFYVESWQRRQDGQERLLGWWCRALKDADGRVTGALSTARDITERRRVEEELRLQAMVLDQIEDRVTVTDLEGTITYVNNAECRALKHSREDLTGRSVELYGEDPARGATQREIIEKTRSEGEWRGEIVNFAADGTDFVLDCRTRLIRDSSGLPVAMCGIATDITERKRIEEELRVASLYARSLIESGLDPLVTINPDGKIADVNKATEEVTGVSREKLIGTDFSDYFTEPDKAREGYQQVFAQGVVRDYPLTIRHSTGYNTDVLYNASVYRNEAGEVQGVFAAAHDITERKRAEEKVRESEEKYRTLFENMAQGVFCQRADGALVDVNAAALHIFGLSREEFLKRTSCDRHWDVIREDGTPIPPEKHPSMEALSTRKPVLNAVVGCYNPTERSYRWVTVNAIPQFWPEESQPYQVFVTLHDITDRKQAEEAMRESEEKFRALIETTSTGYVIIDVTGKVVDANDEYVRLTGHKHRNEILGRSVLEWTAAYDRERNAKALGDCAREGFLKNLTIDYIGPAGQTIPIEGSGTLVATKSGALILTLCRDISERKQVEEMLNTYCQQVRAIAALLMRLDEIERKKLAQELHDQVGQTLTALEMNLSLIQSQLPADTPAKVGERLNEALAQAEEMMERIRDVMSNLRPSVLDDYGLVAALHWLCRCQTCHTGIVVEVKAEESISRSTPELETAFFRIAQETLNNMAKHAQARNATIILDQKSKGLCMTIADDGVGFDTETKAEVEGRHWGLLIMRERARAVGADFRVESALGKGTRVIVEEGGYADAYPRLTGRRPYHSA